MRLRKWAIFDLDGTLCDTTHREHLVTSDKRNWDEFNRLCILDPPRAAEVALLHAWWNNGHDVVIMTGRSEVVRVETVQWLSSHYLEFEELYMRGAGDHRPSEVIKREWYAKELDKRGGQKPMFIIEDRDKMVKFWRGLGLTCFQGQPGAY